MKKTKIFNIPKITMSYTLSVKDTTLKQQTFSQDNQSVKELERFLALMEHTQLNGTLTIKMLIDGKTLFNNTFAVKDGKLEGIEL